MNSKILSLPLPNVTTDFSSHNQTVNLVNYKAYEWTLVFLFILNLSLVRLPYLSDKSSTAIDDIFTNFNDDLVGLSDQSAQQITYNFTTYKNSEHYNSSSSSLARSRPLLDIGLLHTFPTASILSTQYPISAGLPLDIVSSSCVWAPDTSSSFFGSPLRYHLCSLYIISGEVPCLAPFISSNALYDVRNSSVVPNDLVSNSVPQADPQHCTFH